MWEEGRSLAQDILSCPSELLKVLAGTREEFVFLERVESTVRSCPCFANLGTATLYCGFSKVCSMPSIFFIWPLASGQQKQNLKQMTVSEGWCDREGLEEKNNPRITRLLLTPGIQAGRLTVFGNTCIYNLFLSCLPSLQGPRASCDRLRQGRDPHQTGQLRPLLALGRYLCGPLLFQLSRRGHLPGGGHAVEPLRRCHQTCHQT